MSSVYEFRFMRRHPLVWAKLWWPMLFLSALLMFIALTWTDEAFTVLRLNSIWPVGMAFSATLVFASTVAPFSERLRTLAGAVLATFGGVRAFFSIEAALFVVEGAAVPQLAVQAAHWSIITLVGLFVPTFVADTASQVAVEAGKDDRE